MNLLYHVKWSWVSVHFKEATKYLILSFISGKWTLKHYYTDFHGMSILFTKLLSTTVKNSFWLKYSQAALFQLLVEKGLKFVILNSCLEFSFCKNRSMILVLKTKGQYCCPRNTRLTTLNPQKNCEAASLLLRHPTPSREVSVILPASQKPEPEPAYKPLVRIPCGRSFRFTSAAPSCRTHIHLDWMMAADVPVWAGDVKMIKEVWWLGFTATFLEMMGCVGFRLQCWQDATWGRWTTSKWAALKWLIPGLQGTGQWRDHLDEHFPIVSQFTALHTETFAASNHFLTLDGQHFKNWGRFTITFQSMDFTSQNGWGRNRNG